jgi:Putative zinc-finger
MPDIKTIHPRANRLKAYAQGRLDEPEMDEIEQHLSSCDSCCRTVRDQPEDSLVAKLRGRGAVADEAQVTDVESAAEPPSGFQVPSSFVVGPGVKAPRHDQTTVVGPPPDPPALAGLSKARNDHPRYCRFLYPEARRQDGRDRAAGAGHSSLLLRRPPGLLD